MNSTILEGKLKGNERRRRRRRKKKGQYKMKDRKEKI
jgi:hypothetical protein